MDVAPLLDALAAHDCRFVVVGSAARRLVGGESGGEFPVHDLDVVVDGGPGHRDRVVAALTDTGALVRRRRGWVPVGHCRGLSWDWGWRARTVYGSVDVIVRFVDGTTFEEHAAAAVGVPLPNGAVIRCHPTRHR